MGTTTIVSTFSRLDCKRNRTKQQRKRIMTSKLKTIGAATGLTAVLAFASSAAFACEKWSSAGDARTFAQNATSGGQTDVQKQTDPSRNGTSQSEDTNGANKNGQPQR
jgi:hypothetical protein